MVLLTIGNTNSNNVIFMPARVHPCENVYSFIMEGFFKELIGDSNISKRLRKNISSK